MGYEVANPKNETEVYQLIISNRTGTVLLIKPHYMVRGNVTYMKLLKFIFGKFEMDFGNFHDHIAVYSQVTWHKFEENTA